MALIPASQTIPIQSQGALGNGLPDGFTADHFESAPTNGIYKFNDAGIKQVQSQIPQQPSLIQNAVGAFQPMQQQNAPTNTPPPISPQQADMAYKFGSSLAGGSTLGSAMGSAAGAGAANATAGASGGGLYDLLAAIF